VLPTDPVRTFAGQSVSISDLLGAAVTRLKAHLRSEARVVTWLAELEERPPVEGADVCGVGFGSVRPRPDPGAGRLGYPAAVEVVVGVWTRYLGDMTGDHTAWLDAHSKRLVRAWGAVAGKMLYASYHPRTGAATGRPLTVAACQLVPGEVVVKPVDRHEAGVSVFRFRAPVILPLDPTSTA
jgi:hypothetical protein